MVANAGCQRVAWLDDALEVTWRERSVSRLPYLWLRDNCGCGECRVAQTGEKRFILNQVPANLQPAAGMLRDDELLLAWPDGHESRYSGSAIRALEAEPSATWKPWDARFSPRRFDCRRFLTDDAVADAALTAFLASGAFVLTGAGATPGSLETLAPRLGPLREMVFGRVHDVKVDLAGYNVAHTAMELPPHNDFASCSWPPSVQALHMLVNDASGGDTVIVDGWRIGESLRKAQPAYFDILCRMPVPFRMFDEATETRAEAPIFQLDTDGGIRAFRFSNQLMQRIPPNRPGLASFYRAYHELCRRVTSDSAKARFRLRGGQVLVTAAHRVLHGREAFRSDGRRHLQDAYFEHDSARNHLLVLQRRLDGFAGSES